MANSNKHLEIKNFKSIKNIEIETSRVNLFIGKPNSGKSNLIEALTLFNFIQAKEKRLNEPTLIRYNSLDNLFYDRNLANDIQVNFGNNLTLLTYYSGVNAFLQIINPLPDFVKKIENYKQEQLTINEFLDKQILNQTHLNIDSFTSKVAVLDLKGSIISIKSNIGNIENPIRRYEFRDGVPYDNLFAAYLKSSGDNLYTIVQNNPNLREWIISFYEEFGLEFLMDYASRTFEIQKKEKGIVYKIPFELTPDTFRRMLFHVAAIYSNKNATILLEEPESHSFPPYVNELSELIKADKENTYFITTHSPYVFNSMVEDSEKVKDISFFHVYYEDYQTKIKKLTQEELDNISGSGADVFFNIDSFIR
jgi:AAA15 family ATPase/GTPase